MKKIKELIDEHCRMNGIDVNRGLNELLDYLIEMFDYSGVPDFINHARKMKTNTALLFEAALGIPAYILLGLQMDYNMQIAKQDKSFVERLSNIRKIAATL